MTAKVIHPATFSDSILRYLANSSLVPDGVLLDPFAGVGKVHQLASASRLTVGVEIEPVWAAVHPRTIVANALHLPFRDEAFDGAVTSPVYGNRMSDSHHARDGSIRRSYTHDLQRTVGDASRQLHPDNAGTLYAWQPPYWRLHAAVWREVWRVLRPGAAFLLNVSDCYRTQKGQRKLVPIVDGHMDLCDEIGFDVVAKHRVETPRMRMGENGHRVAHEVILEMTRP